ncbi:hypothetical protein [Roseovarius sp. 2305UL8-3]|uniref:hypothetical protein n=1 Tax=Roseovarius conchicola TaxID=3121636 RepID=UPI003528DA6C
MTRFFSLITAATFGMAACAPLPRVTGQALGPNAVLDGGRYSSGGGITVAAEARNINGMTALCGVWAESKSQSALTRQKGLFVVQTGTALLGREVIRSSFGFMKKVPAADDYTGQPATCVVTERPWQPGDNAKPLTLRFPNLVVHREKDGLKPGPIVTFKQTGPEA